MGRGQAPSPDPTLEARSASVRAFGISLQIGGGADAYSDKGGIVGPEFGDVIVYILTMD